MSDKARVLTAYRKAKEQQKLALPLYQPGGEWATLIKRYYHKYIEDPGLLDSFLLNAPGLTDERKILLDLFREYFPNVDMKKLEVPLEISSHVRNVNGASILTYSFKHFYFAEQVKKLNVETVAEIGVGYGGFAHYLLKDTSIKYIGLDLPEILLLSSYYLLKGLPNKKFLLYGEKASDYDLALLPNFELSNLENESVDLFITTGTLSELSPQTIEKYLQEIDRICKRYFYFEAAAIPKKTLSGFSEIPVAQFPIPKTFHKVYEQNSPFGVRYREYLYDRDFNN